MKKISLLTIVLCLTAFFSSCNKDKGTTNLHIKIFPFQVIDEPLAKASASEAVTKLQVYLFDANDNAVDSVIQNASDANFGTIDFTAIPSGSYTIVALGHIGSTLAVVSSPTVAQFPNGIIPDAFCATRNITIGATADLDLNMVLDRMVAEFRLCATTPMPAEVASIEINYSASGTHFNPTTALATSNTGYSFSINTNGYAGQLVNPHCTVLLNSDPQTMDVVVNAKNSAGTVLFTHTFTNVQFQRNHRITASGPLFGSNGTGSITFNNTWIDDTANW